MVPVTASVGKTIRMNRLFRDDGKALMVAINQGITMGPRDGIEDVAHIIQTLMGESPDSFTLHRGMAMRTADLFAGRAALILKATNRTKFFGPDEFQVASAEDAVALGADAISFGLTVADKNEPQTIALVSKLVSRANQFGLPTVAHAYPSGNLIENSVRYSVEHVGYAVRIAKELGIDIIKTYWTGSAETFAKIVAFGAPCKVVISGGPRCETLRACFDMTWQGIQGGCHGITYGRNIWQHPYPAAVLRGLRKIVHENATVDEAMEAAEDCAHTHLV